MFCRLRRRRRLLLLSRFKSIIQLHLHCDEPQWLLIRNWWWFRVRFPFFHFSSIKIRVFRCAMGILGKKILIETQTSFPITIQQIQLLVGQCNNYWSNSKTTLGPVIFGVAGVSSSNSQTMCCGKIQWDFALESRHEKKESEKNIAETS